MAITMQAIINATGKNRRILKLISVCALPMLSWPALASDWNFKSSVSIAENYTSNLFLDNDDEVSSFSTTVSPGFSLSKQGARIQSNVSYRLNYTDYSASEGDDAIRHNLNANLNSELIEDHFFIDTQAAVSQQFLSTSDVTTGSIEGLDANTTETYTFRISPYWRQRIGDDATLVARVTYSHVSFDSEQANDTQGVNANIAFDFAPSSSKVFWGLSAEQSQNNPDGNTSSTAQSTSAFVGYRFSSQLSTRFTYGYVDNDIETATESRADSGEFWGVSADWSPGSLTTINASYNSRLQATSNYGLTINRRIRDGAFVLNYSEGISDFQSSFLDIRPPYLVVNTETLEVKTIQVENYQLQPNETILGGPNIGVSAVDDKFINKSLTADLSFSRGKSSYTTGVFHRTREYQSGSIDEETDLGLNLGWSNQLNRRMSSSLNYNWSEIELSDGTTDQLNSITLRLRRTLSRDTSASVSFNYRNRDSEVSTRNYDEYGVGLNFSHNF